MRTDQLGERLKISLEVYAIRFRHFINRMIQFAGLGTLLLGAYAMFRRIAVRQAIVRPSLDTKTVGLFPHVPDPLGSTFFVLDPIGNILLIALGALVVWFST